MPKTPVSLLERLREPDQSQAWRQFVRLYTPLLYHWAHRLGLNQEDAADLVQDVFVVLLQKLPAFTYDRHKSFHGWLRTVFLNHWRTGQRRWKAPEVNLESAPGLLAPDDAEAFGEAEYRRHVARRALELMRADFQQTTWKACWEHVVNGRPAAEVAAELGITINAVYIAKSRVLRRLREELRDLLD